MLKAYDSLDRGRCMEIIRGYGKVPKIQRLLHRYWYIQKVVPKAGNCFGHPFNAERVVTQGDPVSPTISNIVVDAVVSSVHLEVYVP